MTQGFGNTPTQPLPHHFLASCATHSQPLLHFFLQVGRETFRVCRDLLDGVVLVNNAAISGAIRDVYSETRTVLEPAGALAVAGARAYLERNSCQVLEVVLRAQPQLPGAVDAQPGHYLHKHAELHRRRVYLQRHNCQVLNLQSAILPSRYRSPRV